MKASHLLESTVRVGLVILMVGLGLASASPTQAQENPLFQYIAPRRGALLVSRETTLAVRQGEPLEETSLAHDLFTVIGSASGAHTGRVELAGDDLTVIFTPDAPFLPGETVSVTVRPGLRSRAGARLRGTSWSFTVSPKTVALGSDPSQQGTEHLAARQVLGLEQGGGALAPDKKYVTVPADLPSYTVTNLADGVSEGYFLLTTMVGGFWERYSHLLIIDNQGELVYFHRSDQGKLLWDLQGQPNGLLTFLDGRVTMHLALDSQYRQVRTYRPGNGYWADLHDLRISPAGNALFLIYDYQQIDMSQVVPGGSPEATVIGLIVQEVDDAGHVLFEWRSWDHIPITDTYVDVTAPTIDYMHSNALDWDLDGNILVSSRHLSEITKIDRQTGDIIWRWGGRHNEFTLVNDQRGFSFQHDIRVLPNGHYTLYDNGVLLMPQFSRALEYRLDEANRTATLVWSYRDSPDVYAPALGSVQRLDGGNTLIGWGANTLTATEVKPDGTKVFELSLNGALSYRARKVNWEGRPTWPPVLVAWERDGKSNLVVSWNGATEVASYQFYGGNTRDSLEPIGTATKTGFETWFDVTSLVNRTCYFAAIPIDKQGEEMMQSNVALAFSSPCADETAFLPLLSVTAPR